MNRATTPLPRRDAGSRLPAAASRLHERAVGAGAALPRRVRITQRGEMVSRRGGRPLAFHATQEYEVERVGFAWRATFSPAPLLRLHVVDEYRAGEGGFSLRLWNAIPLGRSTGADVARGQALRYLAELPWVPHAIEANGDLEWREPYPGVLEVAANVAGRRECVRLDLDARGDVVTVSTRARPRRVRGGSVETPWAGTFGDYAELGGVRIPTTAAVRWELPAGPFTYWRGEVLSLDAA